MTNRPHQAVSVTGELAQCLRDGLLQDLLAVSMLIEGARARVGDRDAATASELLGEAGATVRVDVDAVRALIERLRDRPTAQDPAPGAPWCGPSVEEREPR